MISFPLVCKAHAVVAIVFGLIFLVATFGYSLPLIGPEALLLGWDTSNAALMYMSRFAVGLMGGIAYFEWDMAEHERSKAIFWRYHLIVAALALYSTVGAAVYWFSWSYALLITLFFVGGLLGKTDGYSNV